MYNPRPATGAHPITRTSARAPGEGVRFTGGEARGRGLKAPRGRLIRPTSDRVREALFDILGARVRNSTFLDAYAGTGAVGCEALSRGARRVVFLERHRDAVRIIKENLGTGSWAGMGEVVTGEAQGLIGDLRRRGERFDIVFLDPPYDEPELSEVLALAAELVLPGGALVLEHRSTSTLPSLPIPHLSDVRSYRHGDTTLTVFRNSSPSPQP